MNAVLGFSGLLLESSLTPMQRDYVTTIHDSGTNLLTLLNDILDISKLEAGRMSLDNTDFSVAEVLENTVSLLAPQAASKRLTLNIALDPAVPLRCRGDGGRLGQIMMNLTSNAIKFTETGTITLRARLVGADAETSHLGFDVVDTGPGISTADQARLFTRFTQLDASTSRQHGGTGLGLAICQELVILMGGKIGVENNRGQGSRFWFTVRVQRASTVPYTGPTPRAIPLPRLPKAVQPRRILVAEDNPVNRKVVSAILQRAGHNVDLVANGQEAMDAVTTVPYDLVLMDAHMPEMDGIEATRAIRAGATSARNIPIIALTADALSGDRERYIAAGMTDYIAKPIEAAELLATITRITAPAHRSVGRPLLRQV